MSKCLITFLFDDGQVFQESWELAEGHSESLPARIKRIAFARLPLLASIVRIVLLKAKGNPLERVDLRGIGGAYAPPRYGLKLVSDDRNTSIYLRGIPREIYAHGALTEKGNTALAMLSKTLNECGAVVVRNGQAIPITKLWARRQTLFSYRKDKKATLRKLVSILGDDEAHRVWEEMKKKREGRRVPAATAS